MKIAITARGIRLDSEVDPRFGRAPYILIVDTETLAFEAVDNSENVNAFKGAGIKAASMVSERGAQVLMTGYCGPKAFTTLEAAGVKVVKLERAYDVITCIYPVEVTAHHIITGFYCCYLLFKPCRGVVVINVDVKGTVIVLLKYFVQ